MDIKNVNDWKKFIQLAKKGDCNVMNEIAMHLRDGLIVEGEKIVEVDTTASFEWTKKSYENNNIEGMIEYANHLSNPENNVCDKDIDLAIEIYKKALKRGSDQAAYCLGIEYRNKQDFKKAFEYYLIAKKSDEFYADVSIGLCYYYGIGVEKDKKKAFEIFKNINQSSSSAFEVNEINYLLGKMYLEGEVAERNIDKAREHLELANEDGDHRSALELLLIIGRTNLIDKS